MVENVYYVDCGNVNPYHCQGLQSYLLKNIPDDSMVFMMWQSMDTVSLGNQQSAYHECNIDRLEFERTYLERRDSMGKALYFDLGCVHYAFFMYLNNYNIMNQINVIYQALSQLDLQVYLSQNNELFLEGKQITDNIYYTNKEKCMHSGIIYWDADKSKRFRLLKEAKSKQEIGNIVDVNPLVNMSQIKKHILQSLADQYGPVYQLSIVENFEDYVEHYHSYKYIYDTDNNYVIKIMDEFENGQIQIYLTMNKNMIILVDAYTKNENVELTESIKKVFENLIMDDVVFKMKMSKINNSYLKDFTKIYNKVKKESYRI